jgi:hypothetical protein
MECDRCGSSMDAGECRQLGGKKLCEDSFLRQHQQRQQVFIALF